MIRSAVLLAVVILVSGGLMLSRRLSRSTAWRATVTPLASIMGSGFLVCAPLLAQNVGYDAVFAMAGLLAVAFAVGGAIRFNIRHVEPVIEDRTAPDSLRRVESGSRWILAAAYVVSITYYLQLLAAFVLHMVDAGDPIVAKWLTTLVLVVIGGVGYFRGLSSLESLERIAIGLNLGMIAALVTGLIWFNLDEWLAGEWRVPDVPPDLSWHSGRVVLGLLIVVQGFETSRYLGGRHPAEERIRTMRIAQIVSAGIYLVFLALLTVLFHRHMDGGVTAIVDIAGRIAPLLPAAVVVAAVGSQFSAAVADSAGAGGLIREISGDRLSMSSAYALLCAFTVCLTWLTDVTEIIAIASRAFAAFYALQCVSAALASRSSTGGSLGSLRGMWFITLALACSSVAVFGIASD